MSGGHWGYENDSACRELFGWNIDALYGLNSEEVQRNERAARKLNPLEDKELSELVYDVFCLLHSYDWYISGDTGEEDYRDDVKYFKEKWLNRLPDERIKQEIEKTVDELKENLRKEFGCE